MWSRMKLGKEGNWGISEERTLRVRKPWSESLLSACREQQRGQWGWSGGDEAREVRRDQITRRPPAPESKGVARPHSYFKTVTPCCIENEMWAIKNHCCQTFRRLVHHFSQMLGDLFYFLVVIKYTSHNIDHVNHLYVHNSMANTLLGNHHHHPSPESVHLLKLKPSPLNSNSPSPIAPAPGCHHFSFFFCEFDYCGYLI